MAVRSPRRQVTRDDVADLLAARAVHADFQPVVSMHGGHIIGYEALARMDADVVAGPDRWLDAAEAAGWRADLERLCLEAALANGLPPGQTRLFVNLSPSLLTDPSVRWILDGVESSLVLELSETQIISDYDRVRDEMIEWASRGTQLAIDDTGSGYASLRHVLQLCPDYIKLDRSLVDGIESDRNRQALMNALVAFSKTLGAAVIAEGVERAEELEVVRDAGVELVQGYLLARPGPAWPSAADPSRNPRLRGLDPRDRLQYRLDAATDPRTACEAVVDHLAQAHGLLPSVYLLTGDRLRCQAQRGLWQVLDGLTPGAGITGRCYVEGRELVVDDVTASSSYLEAIPGVRAEVCVPIRVEGLVVGALNVESRAGIREGVIEDVRAAGIVLGERLAVVGRSPVSSSMDQLGFHVRRLSDAVTEQEALSRLAHAAVRMSGLGSVALSLADPFAGTGEAVVLASGPLRDALTDLPRRQLEHLVARVHGMTSCYTAGTSLDQGFVDLDGLRRCGVRALVVVPLVTGATRYGLMVLADTAPGAFRPTEIEPLELLAAHAAAVVRVHRLSWPAGDLTATATAPALTN